MGHCQPSVGERPCSIDMQIHLSMSNEPSNLNSRYFFYFVFLFSALTPTFAGNPANDVFFPVNLFVFNDPDEAATSPVMAIVDGIAWEGVECFTFQINTATCVSNDPTPGPLGPTPETQICVIDRTRK